MLLVVSFLIRSFDWILHWRHPTYDLHWWIDCRGGVMSGEYITSFVCFQCWLMGRMQAEWYPAVRPPMVVVLLARGDISGASEWYPAVATSNDGVPPTWRYPKCEFQLWQFYIVGCGISRQRDLRVWCLPVMERLPLELSTGRYRFGLSDCQQWNHLTE